MKLSENFSFEELTTTEVRDIQGTNRLLAQQYIPSLTKLAELLEQVRGAFGKPIIIHSGFRCAELNHRIGGSPTSQHCVGQAADFHVLGWDKEDDFMEGLKVLASSDIRFGQLLIEAGCLHISLPKPNVVEGEVGYWSKGTSGMATKVIIRPARFA